MQNVVIFGVGNIAEIVGHYLDRDKDIRVVAHTVDRAYLEARTFQRRPVVPFDEVANRFPPSGHQMFIAIGYHEMNSVRTRVCERASEAGYTLVSYVHPSSSVFPGVEIGGNCFVMEGVVIQAKSKIGSNVFVAPGVMIGHHSTIEDHCWLSSGAILGGHNHLGKSCFLGINVSIGHLIDIGEETLITAGSLVTRGLPAGSVVVRPDTPMDDRKTKEYLKEERESAQCLTRIYR